MSPDAHLLTQSWELMIRMGMLRPQWVEMRGTAYFHLYRLKSDSTDLEGTD